MIGTICSSLVITKILRAGRPAGTGGFSRGPTKPFILCVPRGLSPGLKQETHLAPQCRGYELVELYLYAHTCLHGVNKDTFTFIVNIVCKNLLFPPALDGNHEQIRSNKDKMHSFQELSIQNMQRIRYTSGYSCSFNIRRKSDTWLKSFTEARHNAKYGEPYEVPLNLT
jgi:hypothetical protein